jgi:hypothetical protein
MEPAGGGRAVRTELWTRDSPAWLWAALLASLIVALIAGAIVAVAATRDEEEQAGPEAAASAGTGSGSTETVSVITGAGTITVEQPDTGAAPPPAGPIGEWPADTSGFTVVLASVEQSRPRAEAEAVAARANGAGLPQTGVLDSSAFSSLRPGYWVAFSGVYPTLEEAQAALAQARNAGFPLAYVREITP